MDNKMPKEYVAELLKQLEELKRKKARKERKLQKIKGCSLNDLKKERAKKASNNSIEKESDQIKINENSLKKLDGGVKDHGIIICERRSSNSFDDINFEKSSNSHSINNKEVLVSNKHDSLHLDNDEFNKDIKSHSDTKIKECTVDVNEENVKNYDLDGAAVNCHAEFDSLKHDSYKVSKSGLFLKPNNNKQTTNSEKHNLSLLKNSLSCDVEKSPVVIENEEMESKKHNLSFLNDVIDDIEKTSSSVIKKQEIQDTTFHNEEKNNNVIEKIKQPNIIDNLMSVTETNTAKNFTNSYENVNKLSDESSNPNSKGKSSDILDDSLNSNMSFFMSADLFVNDEIDRKDLMKDQNENKLSVKNNKGLSPIKKEDSNISNPKLPNPVQLNLSVNKHNDFEVFNFPKFSTPTEGNTQVEKDDDDIPDLIEKTQSLSDPEKEKILKNAVPPANKFDTPLLNFVLEKRLSSVLDAHYESPKKVISKIKISSAESFDEDVSEGNAFKKRKLFSETNCNISLELKTEGKDLVLDIEESDIIGKSFEAVDEIDEEMKCNNASAFDSGSFDSLKNVSTPPTTFVNNSCDDVSSQVHKAVDGLVNEVCVSRSDCENLNEEDACKNEVCMEMNIEESKDSEILIIPETEGLGLYFSKDTEDFLETSTLSESMQDFPAKENFLNVSSQSKLESPVVNNIVAAVKSSKSFQNVAQRNKLDVKMDCDHSLGKDPEKMNTKVSNDASSSFENSLDLNTSFMEDDTQDLGNFKQVPYMNDVNVSEKVVTDEIKTDDESNLKFVCALSSLVKEPVMDVEIILFHDVKYAILEYKTHICVWRQEKNEQWIKIFNHEIEDMFSLEKICVSMDENNLVIIMLLCNEEQYCLQFLIFERNARVIKLMENTHWLEESVRCSKDSILLCGLSGLMFAIAQNKENPEVSIHALISLKENPRLMTAVLGSTETSLCSLCKIDKLPNALMGISESMLYVWHIHEARLVTAVSLHPRDYIPIKECFWATVESGLIFFLTTCEDDDYHVCQLLVANLATGLCKTAMTYSTLPSDNKVQRIIKAVYLEPYLIVAHSGGALLWSVEEEYCCASLSAIAHVTTIAISRDFDNFGLLAVGFKNGLIHCYSLH